MPLLHAGRRLRTGYLSASHETRHGLLACLLLLGIAPPIPAAVPEPRQAGLCDTAAVRAARRFDVPVDVMRAITRTETGRPGKQGPSPWPWTVNMEGRGAWFDDRDAALAFVFGHFKRGARSFDVGCFQINYKWHSGAFATIQDMFDPQRNADYAAGFLRSLFEELGDWTLAAGAYHSRTPKYARRYRARFETIRASLKPAGPALSGTERPRDPGPPVWRLTQATAPLLGRGGQATRGSLVPLGGPAASRSLIPGLAEGRSQ